MLKCSATRFGAAELLMASFLCVARGRPRGFAPAIPPAETSPIVPAKAALCSLAIRSEFAEIDKRAGAAPAAIFPAPSSIARTIFVCVGMEIAMFGLGIPQIRFLPRAASLVRAAFSAPYAVL